MAGSSDRLAVDATYLQPFLAKGLGRGLTATANLEATYDYEGRNWVVPMNLTLSQVMKLGGQLVSIGGGVRYYFKSPSGGADWGLRATFTLLYPK